MISWLVASQAERCVSGIPSFESTKVVQFMILGPPTFTGVNMEEDPQSFLEGMETIFRVMHAMNVERVDFAAYQLKDVVYALEMVFDMRARMRKFTSELSHVLIPYSKTALLIKGFCDEKWDMCFKCGQPGHTLRNCPIGKVGSGANKILVSSSSTPAPKGVASTSISAFSIDTGWNQLYALVS
ncbi:uncharacterized protein LOC124887818 [Capsicum annuum]|uniref:uncharacterized protein LOC124887818 n=1 Tax=Capsicum annuum TaxID=4072 RepID=UPI001FB0F50C|nr:uncharacterized protein LOC124887818 [Capsicum annuum]